MTARNPGLVAEWSVLNTIVIYLPVDVFSVGREVPVYVPKEQHDVDCAL